MERSISSSESTGIVVERDGSLGRRAVWLYGTIRRLCLSSSARNRVGLAIGVVTPHGERDDAASPRQRDEGLAMTLVLAGRNRPVRLGPVRPRRRIGARHVFECPLPRLKGCSPQINELESQIQHGLPGGQPRRRLYGQLRSGFGRRPDTNSQHAGQDSLSPTRLRGVSPQSAGISSAVVSSLSVQHEGALRNL